MRSPHPLNIASWWPTNELNSCYLLAMRRWRGKASNFGLVTQPLSRLQFYCSFIHETIYYSPVDIDIGFIPFSFGIFIIRKKGKNARTMSLVMLAQLCVWVLGISFIYVLSFESERCVQFVNTSCTPVCHTALKYYQIHASMICVYFMRFIYDQNEWDKVNGEGAGGDELEWWKMEKNFPLYH